MLTVSEAADQLLGPGFSLAELRPRGTYLAAIPRNMLDIIAAHFRIARELKKASRAARRFVHRNFEINSCYVNGGMVPTRKFQADNPQFSIYFDTVINMHSYGNRVAVHCQYRGNATMTIYHYKSRRHVDVPRGPIFWRGRHAVVLGDCIHVLDLQNPKAGWIKRWRAFGINNVDALIGSLTPGEAYCYELRGDPNYHRTLPCGLVLAHNEWRKPVHLINTRTGEKLLVDVVELDERAGAIHFDDCGRSYSGWRYGLASNTGVRIAI